MNNPAPAAPKDVNRLRSGIAAVARERQVTVKRLQALVGNIVVAQMLPRAAVKGGTGLKLRLGDRITRETPDLDAAFRGDRDAFLTEFSARLLTGWGECFSGTAHARAQRAPTGLLERVSTAYVMQPIDVKLRYRDKVFMTVELELGHDELEATTRDEAELEMSAEVLETFSALGLPEPGPVRVLPLHHQISQKLHACTERGSRRAHDLVDLQLMAELADPVLVRETAIRLFRYRAGHEWPPRVVPGPTWEATYAESAEGLEVLGFGEAVAWTNSYIARVDSARGADAH